MSAETKRIAILGASGYAGAELVRLLLGHPHVSLVALSADRQAGKALAEIFPQFHPYDLPMLTQIESIIWDQVDFVFCALPHGTVQAIVAGLPERLRIVDLSADFRLSDHDVYAHWYGKPHMAPDLQNIAVYGLSEIEREAIRHARLVANPGCYPATAQLPLIPLLEAQIIEPDAIIIDAKSGVTGAGRAVKEALMFSEVAEGIQAYSIAAHRHAPEIDQTLTRAAGRPVMVSFTPHLVPMKRGILATIYVKLRPGIEMSSLRHHLTQRYAAEPFVHVLPENVVPETRHVIGSNHCFIGLSADRQPGHAILTSVTDNLVKGASGQAIHNMNLMLGWPERCGLNQPALFP